MTQNAHDKPRLTTLPALPTNARLKNFSRCACGCDGLTQKRFVPGHDSRLKAVMLRVARNVMTLAEVAEWGGSRVREAVEEGLADQALMKRWNIVTEPSEGDMDEVEAVG